MPGIAIIRFEALKYSSSGVYRKSLAAGWEQRERIRKGSLPTEMRDVSAGLISFGSHGSLRITATATIDFSEEFYLNQLSVSNAQLERERHADHRTNSNTPSCQSGLCFLLRTPAIDGGSAG